MYVTIKFLYFFFFLEALDFVFQFDSSCHNSLAGDRKKDGKEKELESFLADAWPFLTAGMCSVTVVK